MLRLLTLALMMIAAIAGFGAGADQRADPEPSAHRVNTTKFTIVDVESTQPFYENLLGMQELSRFVAEGFLDEPFMGFAQGGRIGLLAFTEFENLTKTDLPVSVVYVPDLDPVVARLEAARHRHVLQPGRLHVSDPSGNTIELIERPGLPRVAAARLIVDELTATLAFFERAFGVVAARRLSTEQAEEAHLAFGNGGMFVSLYEARPKAEFPRSDQPVVAIYTRDFDGVLERVKAGGARVRLFGQAMFLADDPSGNVVEVVRWTGQ